MPEERSCDSNMCWMSIKSDFGIEEEFVNVNFIVPGPVAAVIALARSTAGVVQFAPNALGETHNSMDTRTNRITAILSFAPRVARNIRGRTCRTAARL